MIRSLLALTLSLLAPLALAAPYALPPLPYAYEALEPHIDTATMKVHHTGHHQAFINNLNRLAGEHEALREGAVEPLLARISTFPAAVRNSLGGHYNHTLFWQNMAPAGKTGAPSAELKRAIERDFGGMEAFRSQFTAAAAGVFGSGWAWLVVQGDGRLAIGTTPGQDNPLMDDSPFRGTPVIGLDVWEHAYYLKHQNRRGDYLADWWQVLNWNDANARYAAATKAAGGAGKHP
jgi:Fe-Mn family superoxide dismutase